MPRRKPCIQAVPFDTPHLLKIKRLSSEQKWLWVVILLLSFQSPISGKLYIDQDIPINEEDLAREASIPLEAVREHLKSIMTLNLLTKEDGVFCIMSKSQAFLNTESQGTNSIPCLSEDSATIDSLQDNISDDELAIAQGMGYTLEEWRELKKTSNT